MKKFNFAPAPKGFVGIEKFLSGGIVWASEEEADIEVAEYFGYTYDEPDMGDRPELEADEITVRSDYNWEPLADEDIPF